MTQVWQGPGVGGRQEGLHARGVLRHEPGDAEGAVPDLAPLLCVPALTFFMQSRHKVVQAEHVGPRQDHAAQGLPHSLPNQICQSSAEGSGSASGPSPCSECGRH